MSDEIEAALFDAHWAGVFERQELARREAAEWREKMRQERAEPKLK